MMVICLFPNKCISKKLVCFHYFDDCFKVSLLICVNHSIYELVRSLWNYSIKSKVLHQSGRISSNSFQKAYVSIRNENFLNDFGSDLFSPKTFIFRCGRLL